MTRKSIGTWYDDPAHFRRPTRRDCLYVGLVGGLGLTLDNFFRLEALAAAAGPAEKAPGKSPNPNFLPGGKAH